MNSISLFLDELKGFYKSNVMLFLWIGLPLLSILFHLWSPNFGEEISFSFVTSSVLGSIGGLFASIMLAVHIIHEKHQGVYELFLIRPIKRRDIILSKFAAVFLCVAVASGLALLLGFAMDLVLHGGIPNEVLGNSMRSFVLSLFTIAIASSAGVLIGVISSSVLVGIILVIFLSSNISSLTMMLPTIVQLQHPFLISAGIGVSLTLGIMLVAIFLFNRLQF